MQKIQSFIDEEAKLNEQINQLSQTTVDSSGSEKIDQNFTKLKQARSNLSQLIEKKNSLHLNESQNFKKALPEIKKQYELYSEDYIKELIWNYSSRINKRINHGRNEDEYRDWLIIKKYVKWLQMDINI